MSYKVGITDLTTLFEPRGMTPKAADVGYKIDGVDVSDTWFPISQGGSPPIATGFKHNGTDLANYFAGVDSVFAIDSNSSVDDSTGWIIAGYNGYWDSSSIYQEVDESPFVSCDIEVKHVRNKHTVTENAGKLELIVAAGNTPFEVTDKVLVSGATDVQTTITDIVRTTSTLSTITVQDVLPANPVTLEPLGVEIWTDLTWTIDPTVYDLHQVTDTFNLVSTSAPYTNGTILDVLGGIHDGQTTITDVVNTPTTGQEYVQALKENVFLAANAGVVDVALIDATHIIIAYKHNVESDGKAVIGTIVGDTVTYGTPVQFTAGDLNYISIAVMDATTVVISYRDSANGGRGTVNVGTISNGDQIAFSGENIYSSGADDTYFNPIAKIDATRFIVAWNVWLGSPSASPTYYKIGTLSGGSVSSWGTQSRVNTNSNYLPGLTLYPMDAAHVLATYRDDDATGNPTVCQIWTISGTNVTNWGTTYQFGDDQSVSYRDLTFLDASTICVAWDDTTAGTGKAVIGTIAGSVITFGTSYTFETNAIDRIGVTSSDSTHFVVHYIDTVDVVGKAIVGEVTGTDIVFGDSITVGSGWNAVAMVGVSSTDVCSVYNDLGNNSVATIMTVGDTYNQSTITVDTAIPLSSTQVIEDGGSVTYDITTGTALTNKFEIDDNVMRPYHVGSVVDITGNTDIQSAITDIVRTIVPVSNPTEISFNPVDETTWTGAGNMYDTKVTMIDSARFLMSWYDQGNADGRCIVGTINTDNTLSWGNIAIIPDSVNGYVNHCLVNDTEFAVVWRSSTPQGKHTVGTINPVDDSISWSTVGVLTSGDHAASKMIKIDTNKFLLIYGNPSYAAYAIIGTITAGNQSWSSSIAIGSSQVIRDSHYSSSLIEMVAGSKYVLTHWYKTQNNGMYGAVIDTSGPNPVLGSHVAYDNSINTQYSTCQSLAINATTLLTIFGKADNSSGSWVYTAHYVVSTISGNTFSWGTAVEFPAPITSNTLGDFYIEWLDGNKDKILTTYRSTNGYGAVGIWDFDGSNITFTDATEYEIDSTGDTWYKAIKPINGGTDFILTVGGATNDGYRGAYVGNIVQQTIQNLYTIADILPANPLTVAEHALDQTVYDATNVIGDSNTYSVTENAGKLEYVHATDEPLVNGDAVLVTGDTDVKTTISNVVRSTSPNPKNIIGALSNNTVTGTGTYASADFNDMIKLTDDTFVIVYENASRGMNAVAGTVDINGDVVYGTPVILHTANRCYMPNIEKLNDTSAAIIWADYTDAYNAPTRSMVITVTGTTITAGSLSSAITTPAATAYLGLGVMSPTKLVGFWMDTVPGSGGDYEYYRIGTVSGTGASASISWTGPTAITSPNRWYQFPRFYALDSSRFLLTYSNSTSGVGARIGTVSGNSISWGTAVYGVTGGSHGYYMTKVSSSRFVMFVMQSPNAKAVVMDISGSDITFNTVITDSNLYQSNYWNCADITDLIDTNMAGMVSVNNGGDVHLISVDINGTALTWNDISTISGGAHNDNSVYAHAAVMVGGEILVVQGKNDTPDLQNIATLKLGPNAKLSTFTLADTLPTNPTTIAERPVKIQHVGPTQPYAVTDPITITGDSIVKTTITDIQRSTSNIAEVTGNTAVDWRAMASDGQGTAYNSYTQIPGQPTKVLYTDMNYSGNKARMMNLMTIAADGTPSYGTWQDVTLPSPYQAGGHMYSWYHFKDGNKLLEVAAAYYDAMYRPSIRLGSHAADFSSFSIGGAATQIANVTATYVMDADSNRSYVYAGADLFVVDVSSGLNYSSAYNMGTATIKSMQNLNSTHFVAAREEANLLSLQIYQHQSGLSAPTVVGSPVTIFNAGIFANQHYHSMKQLDDGRFLLAFYSYNDSKIGFALISIDGSYNITIDATDTTSAVTPNVVYWPTNYGIKEDKVFKADASSFIYNMSINDGSHRPAAIPVSVIGNSINVGDMYIHDSATGNNWLGGEFTGPVTNGGYYIVGRDDGVNGNFGVVFNYTTVKETSIITPAVDPPANTVNMTQPLYLLSFNDLNEVYTPIDPTTMSVTGTCTQDEGNRADMRVTAKNSDGNDTTINQIIQNFYIQT